MLVWLIYDISNDKVRKEVFDLAKEKGLYRVQNSVFLGNITKNIEIEISNEIKTLIDNEEDSVYIFQMNQDNFDNAIFLGHAFNKDLINDKLETFFI
jgi:CRISPR-associated protein Cas2